MDSKEQAFLSWKLWVEYSKNNLEDEYVENIVRNVEQFWRKGRVTEHMEVGYILSWYELLLDYIF